MPKVATVHKVPVRQILSKDHQGQNNAPLNLNGYSASLSIQTKDKCPTEFIIECHNKALQSYSMKFDMGDVKGISIATNRTEVNIHLFGNPHCFRVGATITQFLYLETSKISSLQVVCDQEIPLELTRLIHQEVEAKTVKPRPRGKRLREPCDDCDCCTHYKEDNAKKLLRLEELQKRTEELEEALNNVRITGMTAEFERDFYYPILFQHQKLSGEVAAIKKCLNNESNLLPLRTMGLFSGAVLTQAGLTEAQATELYHDTLFDPTFGPKNIPKINDIRKKYGEAILQDALRCMSELDEYNASAGHPVSVAWNVAENREMTTSEMVVEVVLRYRAVAQENDSLKKQLSDREVAARGSGCTIM